MVKKGMSALLICLIIISSISVMTIGVGAEGLVEYKQYSKDNTANSASGDVNDFSVIIADSIISLEGAQIVAGTNYNKEGSVICTEEESKVDILVKVEKTGLYNILLDYYTVKGRGQDIRFALYIDGELPFEEAASFDFSRVWTDEKEIEQDSLGNDLYVNQIQVEEWRSEYFNDSKGYKVDPFAFYLTEGEHIISLVGLEEPVVMEKLNFTKIRELKSYKDALQGFKNDGYTAISDYIYTIQAETPDKKSAAALSAVSDRTDPAIVPSDIYASKLNTIGGGRFNKSGMWIEYNIDAPEKALYQITFKAKQNVSKDQSSYRNIYINGELLFKEAQGFAFAPSAKYKNIVFGNEDGAYLVPLNKGQNTIKIEAALGEISEFCQILDNSMEVLNAAYRKIVTITGTNPNTSRDYSFDVKMPDVIELFGEQKVILEEVSNSIKKAYGQSNSYTSVIDTLVRQLDEMHRIHYEIAANVSSLNSNISALGSTVEAMKKTDISLDYIVVSSENHKLEKAQAGFFLKLFYGIKNLINSYFADYNNIGAAGKESVNVWMLGGREQAQVLKQLVDSDYSKVNPAGASVRLVSAATTLLQATLAGKGPDVALGVGQTDAMNFAFRGAALDISKMSDFDKIKGDYLSSAFDMLSYKGGVYGLPQTMNFPVMFYRKDILTELELDVPKTWEDVYALLPVLTQNNMAFGFPVSDAVETPRETLVSFGALLYQRGGNYFTDDLSSVTFSDELTIEVMKDWSELYTSYGLPIQYNFANRFAAGSMPIAIQNFSAFQTLILYAPHIADLWDWTLVPGTKQSDGTIDNSVILEVTAAIVIKTAKNHETAWEFVKWWCSKDTQSEYGIFIENLMGRAGRHNTANINALVDIPWSNRQFKTLAEQMKQTVGVPEVPGGYYLGRYLNNAFREIYNNRTSDDADPREIMNEFDRIVDTELAYQRDALARVNDIMS